MFIGSHYYTAIAIVVIAMAHNTIIIVISISYMSITTIDNYCLV